MRVPWTQQRWALPFLCLLATAPEVSAQLGLRHKTLGLRARHVVSLLRRWLPGVPIKLLGDQAYSILQLGLRCPHHQITLMVPFRLDSVIHEPKAVRDPHTRRRPPVVGPRLPALALVLHDPQTVWQRLTLEGYGEGQRMLELCSGTAWWSRFGSPPLPIRSRAHARPSGKAASQGVVFPDQAQSAEEVVCDFMKR